MLSVLPQRDRHQSHPHSHLLLPVVSRNCFHYSLDVFFHQNKIDNLKSHIKKQQTAGKWKICEVQNVAAAARLVSGTRDESISLHWLIDFKIVLLHGLAPKYVSDLLLPYTASTDQLLLAPKTKKSGGDRAQSCGMSCYYPSDGQIHVPFFNL